MRECPRVGPQPSKLVLAGSSPVSRSTAPEAKVEEAADCNPVLNGFDVRPVLQFIGANQQSS